MRVFFVFSCSPYFVAGGRDGLRLLQAHRARGRLRSREEIENGFDDDEQRRERGWGNERRRRAVDFVRDIVASNGNPESARRVIRDRISLEQWIILCSNKTSRSPVVRYRG